MQAIDYSYLLLTPEQHLLSPNSTGHPYRSQCHLHRCHSHSCKSAPIEQHRNENSRELEDGNWLFFSKSHTLQLPTAISRASSRCQTRRVPETCKDRPLTPVSPNSVGSEDLNNQWENNADDELISNWLSGVSSSCLNGGVELTGQSALATSSDAVDSGVKGEVISSLACPTIVLQPPRQSRPTAQTGTGLDGPLSSDSDKLSKMLRDGLNELKESSRSVEPSGGSQKLKSDTSGNGSSANGDIFEEESCLYRLQKHDIQFHVIQRHALNSCPELRRRLDDFERSPPQLKIRDIQSRISCLRPTVNRSRYRHHLRVRNMIANQFRSIGRRFRRSNSSAFSIRSEFPGPLHSKERRLLARDSVDIWPSSSPESPLFNTPESNTINVKRSQDIGRYIDPLAMASMIIATAELDRLSSESSSGRSGNSPVSRTPLQSGFAVPDTPPNAPPSSGTQSSISNLVSRPSQRRAQRRRGQRSRLSEVTTPDDVASPAESTEELNEGLLLSVTHIGTLPECSSVSNPESGDSLYPKPLAIGRSGQEIDTHVGDAVKRGQDFQRSELPEPVPPADLRDTLVNSSWLSNGLDENIAQMIPARVSSICGMPKTSDEPSLTISSPGPEYTSLIPATSCDLKTPATPRETKNVRASTSASLSWFPSHKVATNKSGEAIRSHSCHPDTCIILGEVV
ncbi:hypothetical protein F5Y11DRAFT_355808 [Daldinia sp. FL1419]|nr:hypothetical protein F5Y11DRAFT_355808 [Daldinia sp. FL1419]